MQVVLSGSSSSSNSPSTRSPNRSSAKMEHRSLPSSERGSQKKWPTKVTEVEEELKQVKDELISSKLSKKRLQQEAEQAKKTSTDYVILPSSKLLSSGKFEIEE